MNRAALAAARARRATTPVARTSACPVLGDPGPALGVPALALLPRQSAPQRRVLGAIRSTPLLDSSQRLLGARRRGIEVTAVADLAEGLQFSLAWTKASFEFDRFGSNAAFNGNDLPGLPELQVFGELAYRHASGFYAVADVLYVDDFYVNNANSTLNDDSTVANLRVGFTRDNGGWSIAPYLGVSNVFDEEYMSNVRINGFGGRLYEPGPETYIYAGVTIDFSP